MRRTALIAFAALLPLAALPSRATTTCAYQVAGSASWYECIKNPGFVGTTHWTVSPSGNVDTTHTGQTMCSFSTTAFEKSTGTYGYADLEQTFTTDSSAQANFGIALTVDMKNSHSSANNRLAVFIYNLTDGTAETLATINGAGGDICSHTYIYSVYRPGWVGKDIKLVLYDQFYSLDTEISVTDVSITQRIIP